MPRAERGRLFGWSPLAVFEVLRRPLYGGEIVYGRTQQRDKWGAGTMRSCGSMRRTRPC